MSTLQVLGHAAYKTDILVFVAHPDDETAISSYLARVAKDEQKRVSVVYATRGSGGGNDLNHAHAKALGLIREVKARKALATLGIEHVWFLDGLDTEGQNVLASLANWEYGTVLEEAVRLVRLTRPEVILTGCDRGIPDWHVRFGASGAR